MREARAAAHRLAWSPALESYRRALALDPMNARLRCETGYAAYRAGELDDADRLIAQAQRDLPDPARTPPTLRAPTAMCLYNAALVHEARGRTAEARAALEASLVLRSNDTVRTALERLGGPNDAPDVIAIEGGDDAAIDARVWSLICAEAGITGGCEPGVPDEDTDESVTIRRGAFSATHADGAPFTARIVTGEFDDGGDGSRGSQDHREWLVVRDGDRALAGSVRVDEATMTMDCGPEATRFEWIDLVPGGTSELLVDARGCTVEQSGCGAGGANERRIVVCAAGPLRCVAISLQRDSSYEEYAECGGMYDGELISETYDGYRMDAEIGATSLTLRPTRGTPPPGAPIGATPFEVLLARADLRWGP